MSRRAGADTIGDEGLYRAAGDLGQHRSGAGAADVWCRDCRHRVEPDPAEMAARYGAEMTVPEWHKRLVCSQCGSKAIDFVLTGARQ